MFIAANGMPAGGASEVSVGPPSGLLPRNYPNIHTDRLINGDMQDMLQSLGLKMDTLGVHGDGSMEVWKSVFGF